MQAVAISGSEYKITFKSSSSKAIVVLNDEIMGVTELDSIIIGGLKKEIQNHITLIPVTDDLRGEGVSIIINQQYLRRINVLKQSIMLTDLEHQPLVLPVPKSLIRNFKEYVENKYKK